LSCLNSVKPLFNSCGQNWTVEMEYTHIIWDFNGTLFDDVDAGILSVNKMLSDRGLRTLASREEYREVFGFPIIEYYRRLGFDFEKEPYEVLAPIWVELYNENSKHSKLALGALDALAHFKEKGIPQILLSATELDMLRGQVAELGIEKYFDEIMGLSNIHAYSKKELAINWCAENCNANPIFIGDSEHDFAVAEAVKAPCLLVTNGHQSRKRLEATSAALCADLYDVIKMLE